MNQTTQKLIKRLTEYDNILDIEKTNEQIEEISLKIKILRIILHFCLRLCSEFDIQEDVISASKVFNFLKNKIIKLVNEEKSFEEQKELIEKIKTINDNNRDKIIIIIDKVITNLRNYHLKILELNSLLNNELIVNHLKEYINHLDNLDLLITKIKNCKSNKDFDKNFQSFERLAFIVEDYIKDIKKIQNQINNQFEAIEDQFSNKKFIKDLLVGKVCFADISELDLNDLKKSTIIDIVFLKIEPK